MGCSPFKTMQSKVKYVKIDGIALYRFIAYTNYLPNSPRKRSYCLDNTYLLFGKKKQYSYAMYDSDEYNYYMYKYFLNENTRIKQKTRKWLQKDSLLFFPSIIGGKKRRLLPQKRLGDTDYIFNLGNISGYWTIKSNSVYQSDTEKDAIYIAFRVKGSFMLYENMSEIVYANANSVPDGNSHMRICPIPKHELSSSFIVLKDCTSLMPLTPEQAAYLGMKRLDLDTIELPVVE
jgi:hypothetical protein